MNGITLNRANSLKERIEYVSKQIHRINEYANSKKTTYFVTMKKIDDDEPREFLVNKEEVIEIILAKRQRLIDNRLEMLKEFEEL
jgi:hypothetical protein